MTNFPVRGLAAAVAACAALATPVVQAEDHHSTDNHFEGAYVVLTNEWKHPDVKVDGEKISKSENAPSIGVGYNWAINSHATIGLKLSMDVRSGEYGVGEIGLTPSEAEVLEKSHYSLAVEPGWAFDDHLLVFGIAAYHAAKAELVIDGTSQGTAHLTGFGYGLGFKYALPNHWFVTGEVQRTNYDSATIGVNSVKPTSMVTALGIGYHF